MTESVDVSASLDKLRSWIEARDFCGYDPYDALNSPIIRTLSCGRKWPRIAFTQALVKLPVNVRPLLGIRKGLNPKGLGLLLGGYARLYRTERDPACLEIVDRLLDELERTKSPGWSGACWGYNFDWQSRAFFLPKGTPTIVNSSFVGHALLDAYILSGRERALPLAVSIRDFILRDLNRTEQGTGFCFSYTPNDRTSIHNANLLGVSLLARLDRFAPLEKATEAVRAALDYTMSCQRADGSWFYAEAPAQRWIDSFHTGFNLQSLKEILAVGWGEKYRAAYDRGVDFYAGRFFLDDGTPKYYHDRLYPVDIHAAAQAAAFFSGLGPERAELCGRIVRWMIERFQNAKGFFHFRRTRWGTNRIPYMRWSQAWAFHALTAYLICYKKSQPC
jgi:hypothetical protein